MKKCTICGSDCVGPIGRFRGYDYYRCRDCGVCHYWPLLSQEELADCYAREWNDSGVCAFYYDAESERLNLERSFKPRLALLRKQGFSGRILDVGCSVGTFLAEAHQQGWAGEGMDVAADACSRTAEKLGCPVHQGVLETAELIEGHYDAIHASQVIEHVLDPKAFLTGAHRALRKGGALVLATPIIDPIIFNLTHGIQRRFVPLISKDTVCPHPWGLFPPYHIFIHSTKSLFRILEEAGFRIIWHQKFPWNAWHKMNQKWRAYYYLMNGLFTVTGSGQNIDILAVKK